MTTSRIILVVEDELFIRMMAADILIDAGFSVLEAGDAIEAKAVLASEPEIAVLFTDVNMPGHMDGVALAHHAADQHPAVGLIVTSGACRIDEGKLPPGSRFLPKPYGERELVSLAHQQIRCA